MWSCQQKAGPILISKETTVMAQESWRDDIPTKAKNKIAVLDILGNFQNI